MLRYSEKKIARKNHEINWKMIIFVQFYLYRGRRRGVAIVRLWISGTKKYTPDKIFTNLKYLTQNYIFCQNMDSLASSSFFLSHLATPPSFCLRSCRNICSRPFLCLVRSGFVWLLVLCGTPASFISRIKNHGGNSTAD